MIAASENIFREDFNAWEEARAINDMLLLGKMKPKEVAELLGKSVAYVTSRRSLLSLPEKIQKRFEKKDIPIGYAGPVKKLAKFPEAQEELLDKIIEGMESRYGRTVSTIEEADEFVTKILTYVKKHEQLLKDYGPCPACESKNIQESRYHGKEDMLSCGECGHGWHKGTKEPWRLYELKQQAQEMGFEVDTGEETIKLTPQDVADLVEKEAREKRREQEEEVKQFEEKFRSPVYIEQIIVPMLTENIQKVNVSGNSIEIELIEDSGLHFKGLKKDYKTGTEYARIEVTYGYGSDKQEIAKQVHEMIASIQKS
jgi:hypothetical protein